jgi:glycosyltransferase involved in cell wall biosynthesis
MNVEILCSSRELFGADRSALRLGEALSGIDLIPTLVVPADRPEAGLSAYADQRGMRVREAPIAIASSKGIEAPSAGWPRRRLTSPDLVIYNTTAVLGSAARGSHKVVIVREWLQPRSLRHRLLVARHRLAADAVVGVSTGVIGQWRKCSRAPARQYVVHNWLDRSVLDGAATADPVARRGGILCIGRFNRWKGQDVLADAYEQAFAGRPDDRPSLRFVGSQPGTEFNDRAEAIAARGRTWGWEVLPFASDPYAHFRSAALVVVPSLQPEPFGTVILEAIAHGCRVIAFEGGGPTDIAVSFPGVLKLVARSTSALVAALRGWWEGGGGALSTAELEHARQELERNYSPEAATVSWRPIIDAVARA